MGDVIPFPRPKTGPRPHDYDNLGPASPQLIEDMYWLVNALSIGEIEIIPGTVPVLCGDCIAKGASECQGGPNECGLYGDDRFDPK